MSLYLIPYPINPSPSYTTIYKYSYQVSYRVKVSSHNPLKLFILLSIAFILLPIFLPCVTRFFTTFPTCIIFIYHDTQIHSQVPRFIHLFLHSPSLSATIYSIRIHTQLESSTPLNSTCAHSLHSEWQQYT